MYENSLLAADGHRAVARERRVRIAVITTGGTIAKTYDPRRARLSNAHPIVVEIVQSLRIEGAEIAFHDLMHRDSLDLDEDDRRSIVRAIDEALRDHDAVVVTHGTDTLSVTAEAFCAVTPKPSGPVVFTGAMVPYVIQGSDGRQNLTEALFAARLLRPGVYVVAHNRVLPVPGAVKDHGALTFVESDTQNRN